jgi:hypothetical protein
MPLALQSLLFEHIAISGMHLVSIIAILAIVEEFMAVLGVEVNPMELLAALTMSIRIIRRPPAILHISVVAAQIWICQEKYVERSMLSLNRLLFGVS